MYGRVIRYYADRGYGFIRGEDDNTYFIHCLRLNGELLEAGYFVFFEPFRNDRSYYNAKDVIVIDAVEKKTYKKKKKVRGLNGTEK